MIEAFGDDGGAPHETSMNFDGENVRPFLVQIEERLSLGLDIDALARFAAETPVEVDRSLTVDVWYDGGEVPLTFGVFMDDVDAPDLSFSAPSKPLVDAIDAELERFADLHGL